MLPSVTKLGVQPAPGHTLKDEIKNNYNMVYTEVRGRNIMARVLSSNDTECSIIYVPIDTWFTEVEHDKINISEVQLLTNELFNLCMEDIDRIDHIHPAMKGQEKFTYTVRALQKQDIKKDCRDLACTKLHIKIHTLQLIVGREYFEHKLNETTKKQYLNLFSPYGFKTDLEINRIESSSLIKFRYLLETNGEYQIGYVTSSNTGLMTIVPLTYDSNEIIKKKEPGLIEMVFSWFENEQPISRDIQIVSEGHFLKLTQETETEIKLVFYTKGTPFTITPENRIRYQIVKLSASDVFIDESDFHIRHTNRI